MGLFSLPKKPKSRSDNEAIKALLKIACSSTGDEKEHEKPYMDKALAAVEDYIGGGIKNAKLAYWLGVAWRNYTAWHIRGDERKPFLEKSTEYFRQALKLAKNQLPIRLPLEKRHQVESLDQITIAGDSGFMLVENALMRNLNEAERILKFVAENTQEYEPCLCPYAELYYKRGNYKKAAEIALNAYERAKKSPEWKTTIPPAPLGIAGKAYRALGKKAKKQRRIKEAAKWYQKIVELGVATENDKKTLKKLRQTK